ncbi:MAG: hypothetical protein WC777_02345 [Candidatus Gracilibacteria bacterium]
MSGKHTPIALVYRDNDLYATKLPEIRARLEAEGHPTTLVAFPVEATNEEIQNKILDVLGKDLSTHVHILDRTTSIALGEATPKGQERLIAGETLDMVFDDALKYADQLPDDEGKRRQMLYSIDGFSDEFYKQKMDAFGERLKELIAPHMEAKGLTKVCIVGSNLGDHPPFSSIRNSFFNGKTRAEHIKTWMTELGIAEENITIVSNLHELRSLHGCNVGGDTDTLYILDRHVLGVHGEARGGGADGRIALLPMENLVASVIPLEDSPEREALKKRKELDNIIARINRLATWALDPQEDRE